MIPDYTERQPPPAAKPIVLTVDRRDEFAEMYLLTTMTTREIAAHFGVWQSAVCKWAVTLGLPLRGRGTCHPSRRVEMTKKRVAARYAKYGANAFRTKRYIGIPNYATNTITRQHIKRKPFIVTPEQRAKITESTRKRWRDPEFRAVQMAKMKASRERRLARFWAQIPDRKHYRKLQYTFGAKAARELLGIVL